MHRLHMHRVCSKHAAKNAYHKVTLGNSPIHRKPHHQISMPSEQHHFDKHPVKAVLIQSKKQKSIAILARYCSGSRSTVMCQLKELCMSLNCGGPF